MSTFTDRWTRVIRGVKLDLSKRRWRHKVRGSTYEVVGEAQVQAPDDMPLTDYEVVVVYRGEDGQLWVRRHHEFQERFEPVVSKSSKPIKGSNGE